MATAGATSAAGKWIGFGTVLLALVAVLVWAGTRSLVAAVPSATVTADSPATGLAYLSANKDKSGVHTTASGLQYEVLTEGSGAKPLPGDTVTVHYVGKLIDGRTFDSLEPDILSELETRVQTKIGWQHRIHY